MHKEVLNGPLLNYPFHLDFEVKFEDYFVMPDLLTLAAMKAYTLGRRSKWKDYVDLYFIFQKFSIVEVIAKAQLVFGNVFNAKLFREQLCYFEDIDFTESINYLPGKQVADDQIKDSLVEIATRNYSTKPD